VSEKEGKKQRNKERGCRLMDQTSRDFAVAVSIHDLEGDLVFCVWLAQELAKVHIVIKTHEMGLLAIGLENDVKQFLIAAKTQSQFNVNVDVDVS